ncbi:CopG family transcriptional regulator [Caulobacter sp. S45]|uniref:CopG family transcriptional regulator n=1 Tax=Caulobacter sp. S45 TaxID=1641861 RepID=UPI00157561AA|nr:CopG family transcriptional regulator [Caulobacter sp. S45]
MAQPEPSFCDDVDADAEAAADAEGLADIEAGRTVSGEAVVRWIRSWFTDDELPTPRIGD